MPDGTEHKFDYDPSKPEDVAEADRVLGALVRGESVSGSEFDNLQRRWSHRSGHRVFAAKPL
jgi:hypothetical protein